MALEPLESRDLLAIVSVLALDANASEVGPDAGTYQISRDAPSASPLTVYFSLTGSAMQGTDYSPLPLQATIGPNMVSALLPLTPLTDALTEGPETAILTLTPQAGYTVGTPSSATITIADAAASSPTVTVAATDASASEVGPDTGTYTFTRTGSTAAPLTVYYGLSGSATNGTDYTSLAQVTFPVGLSMTQLTLTPLADQLVEGSETAVLTLAPMAGYTVGTPASATITIADAAASSPTVTVAATDASASEVGPDAGASEVGPDAGTYTFTRTGSTTLPLTVYFGLSGTATSATDYTSLVGQSTFAIGASTTTLTLTPLADVLVEGSETAVLTLTPMPGYTVGTPSSATVTIADNEPPEFDSANHPDTYSFSIAENSASGTAVGTAGATDPNNSPLTYSIIAGNGGGAFAINAATGEITVAIASELDYETVQQYVLTLRVSDGVMTDTATATIAVTNVNEAPTVNPLADQSDIEGGTVTPLQVLANDPEGGALTYSATGLPDGLAIHATTGVISGKLTYSASGNHQVTVKATDAWQEDYNHHRPHSSLGYVTPVEFAARCAAVAPASAAPQPALQQHSGDTPTVTFIPSGTGI